jgi:hypothetical protein
MDSCWTPDEWAGSDDVESEIDEAREAVRLRVIVIRLAPSGVRGRSTSGDPLYVVRRDPSVGGSGLEIFSFVAATVGTDCGGAGELRPNLENRDFRRFLDVDGDGGEGSFSVLWTNVSLTPRQERT